MIVSFRDKGTEDVFDGRNTKQARQVCPVRLTRVARRKLDMINDQWRICFEWTEAGAQHVTIVDYH